MAQNHGAPGTDAVDVLIAVHIPQPGTGGTGHKAGTASHSVEGPHRAVDTAGKDLTGTLEEGLRFFCLLHHQPISPFRMASASSLAK